MQPIVIMLACLFLVAAAQNNSRKINGGQGFQGGPAVNSVPPPVMGHYVPIYAGSNAIAQVEDVRETVGDLLAALENAREGYGLENANAFAANAIRWRIELDTLKEDLDLRTTWISRSDAFDDLTSTIPRTISSSLVQLGKILDEMARSLAGGEKTASLSAYVADDVVDQVDDIREAVIDCIDALRASAEDKLFVLTAEKSVALANVRTRLEDLGPHLAWKESRADEEWLAWFGAEVYKVTVHRSVSDLAQALGDVAKELSSDTASPAH